MRQGSMRTAMALHARPLDRFVQAARRFAAEVRLQHAGRWANGKNVVELLLLAVPAGAEVLLSVDGPDEAEALTALIALLRGDTAAFAEPAVEPPRAISAVAGAPGVGAGPLRRERRVAQPQSRAAGDAAEERARLVEALSVAGKATGALIEDLDPFCDIFRAQRTLLDDPTLRDELLVALQEGVSAESAVLGVFGQLAQRFDALGSAFAAERHADVADVRDRLLEALGLTHPEGDVSELTPVLLYEEATPSRMATLDRQRVAGVISHRGGPSSHTAIVARGRGIPLLFAPPAAIDALPDGCWLLVDGDAGEIVPLPDESAARAATAGRTVTPLSGGPTRTTDGRVIALRANLGAPHDLVAARQVGCDGCGLLRSELLFAGRHQVPSVEEQAAAYGRVARALAPHPTVVRLFDVGADKPLPFLSDDDGRGAARGLRLLLLHPDVLAGQLQAIAQARATTGCDVRALVPMVADAEELDVVRSLASDACPLGVMIETPAAALLARSLARSASFFSIGTNDLSQYTLARDRQAGDHGPLLHPAVLRLITEAIQGAHDCEIECAVCGELAGDPVIAPLLVGLGVDALSLAPPLIPAVRAAIGRSSWTDLQQLADRARTADRPADLQALLARSPAAG